MSEAGYAPPLAGTLLFCGEPTSLASAVAAEAAYRGARVILAGLPRSTAMRIPGVELLPTDPLAGEPEVEALFAALEAQDLEPNAVVLVLPAQALGLVANLTPAEWEAAVTRPLQTAFLVSRHAVDIFLAASVPGRLVLVAAPDNTGGENEPLATALFSLVRSIAKEYGRRGIAANGVVAAGPDGPPSTGALIDAALFLASGEASFMTGEVLTLTGEPGAEA